MCPLRGHKAAVAAYTAYKAEPYTMRVDASNCIPRARNRDP